MKKLLMCLAAIAAAAIAIILPASAQFNGCAAGFCNASVTLTGAGGFHSGAPPSPSNVSAGSITDAGTGAAGFNFSVNVGTASTSRVILVATTRQNSGGFGGVTATLVASDTAQDSHFTRLLALLLGRARKPLLPQVACLKIEPQQSGC